MSERLLSPGQGAGGIPIAIATTTLVSRETELKA